MVPNCIVGFKSGDSQTVQLRVSVLNSEGVNLAIIKAATDERGALLRVDDLADEPIFVLLQEVS